MDPLTSAFNFGTGVLTIWGKVWDALPDDAKKTAASDDAKIIHDLAALLIKLQDKINAAVK
jgi:hypothetical protein